MQRLALLLMAGWIPSIALAVPAQLSLQGKMVDADGEPVVDSASVTFRLVNDESGGTVLWEETQTVSFDTGYYSVLLGEDEAGNPLDDEVLDEWPLWLEVQFDGEAAMYPRLPMVSVPYARQAGVAESLLSGADIDAASLSVGGAEIISSSGQWVGAPVSVDWQDITGVPSGFADDDDADTLSALVCADGQWAVWSSATSSWSCDGFSDTTLTDADVILAVSSDVVDLYPGSTMDGYTILTEDSVVDWSQLSSTPAGLDDGDDDTLASLGCGHGQLAVYDLSATAWTCGDDTDTTLTSAEVIAAVESAAALALPSTTTLSGSALLTTTSTVPWSLLASVPSGLADGDDDTLGALSCAGDAIPVYSGTAWTCGTDTDTTLTAAEVIAAVESASSLSLVGAVSIGGFAVLTENSSLDWAMLTGVPADLADGDDDTLATLACADGEVAVYDSTTGWACGAAGGSETLSVGTLAAGSTTTVTLSKSTNEVALTAYVLDGSDWVLVPIGVAAASSGTCNRCGDGSDGAFLPTTSLTLPCGEYDFTEIDIPAGVTITTSGTDPMIFRVQGNVDIAGTLQVKAGTCGESSTGAGRSYSIPSSTSSCYQVAAGGGSFATSGTAGSGVANGTTYTLNAGGIYWATAGGIPQGGSPGGSITRAYSNPSVGGSGGGVVQIIAANIDVSGAIESNGGDGENASHGVSGGGSGGHIWLVAPSIDISGTASAIGGAGATGPTTTAYSGCGTFISQAGDGGDGYLRLNTDSLTSTGTTTPTPTQSTWSDTSSASTAPVVSASVSTSGVVTVGNESSSSQVIRLIATYSQ